MRHTTVYLSDNEIYSYKDSPGGFSDLFLKGVDHPTVVSDRLVQR